MQDNNVDDLVKNRKQNINLQNFFVKPESIHFFKARPGFDFYARNTCIHNNEFTIDERLKSYNGSGSSGVVRDGEYISSSTGTIKKASIKVVIANKRNIARDLLELKLGIEAYKLIPNCVVEIEFINKCDLLTTNIMPDVSSSTNEILIIGMEKGTNNLRVELNKHINDVTKFKKVISKALKACDTFNKYGFLHRDIKLENIIIVNRNGNESPVLIDFGLTTYMTNINNLSNGIIVDTNLSTYQNPPLDSFYLCLHIYSTYNKYIYLKSIIFDLTYKYYSIIRKLGIDDTSIKNINKSTFDHYNLEIPMDLFVNSIPFVLFSKNLLAGLIYPTYEPDPNEPPRLTTNIISKINSVKIIDFSFNGIKNIFSHNREESSILSTALRPASPKVRRTRSPTALPWESLPNVEASKRSPTASPKHTSGGHPPVGRRQSSPKRSPLLAEASTSERPAADRSKRSIQQSFKLQSLYSTPPSHSVRKTGSPKASRSPLKRSPAGPIGRLLRSPRRSRGPRIGPPVRRPQSSTRRVTGERPSDRLKSFKLQSLYSTPPSHSVRKTVSSMSSPKRSPLKAVSFKLQSLYSTPLSHSIKKSGPPVGRLRSSPVPFKGQSARESNSKKSRNSDITSSMLRDFNPSDITSSMLREASFGGG